jgi:arginine utilization protein RocB
MDLFNTLGHAIGGIDTARERADAAAIEALHGEEPELKEYGVTVELTVSAVNEKEAVLSAQSLLERANRLSKIIYDIERVVEL